MKKLLILLLVLLIIFVGWYVSKDLPASEEETQSITNNQPGPRDATYLIDNRSVTLVDGYSKESLAPDSAATITTKYFGNEVETDLNNDGREDVVFLITEETGGSGTFYYVVAALNTETGWIGSQAVLLGDRIAPQTTEVSQNPRHQNVIVVNYADRLPGETMTTAPSQGKSLYLKLDPTTLQFGQVEANFEGEADPGVMSLDMKTWTWIQTIYSNDSKITPNNPNAFTITFKTDGNFEATTDCNSISGTYELENNNLTFGAMATTRKFCESSQEQDFLAMLSEVKSFSFTNKGELVLNLNSNQDFTTLR